MQGKIIRGIGGFYYVHIDSIGIVECKAKGIFRNKKVKPLVGDNVEVEILDKENKKRSELVAKSLVKYLQKSKEANKFEKLQIAK